MVTIDLNTNQQPNDIFRKIESGEIIRLMRGDRLIALITPAAAIDEALWNSCNWDDETWLAAAAKESAKVFDAEHPDDFSDWNPPHATR